jgi:four helix bundle protein
MGKNFTELEIWQEGKSVAIDVFKIWDSLDVQGYFGLKDQTQRAAVSIPSNIAEGSERKSKAEYIRYLYIAKSSAAELRTQLYIMQDLKIMRDVNLKDLIDRTEILSRKIQKLISVISEPAK